MVSTWTTQSSHPQAHPTPQAEQQNILNVGQSYSPNPNYTNLNQKQPSPRRV